MRCSSSYLLIQLVILLSSSLCFGHPKYRKGSDKHYDEILSFLQSKNDLSWQKRQAAHMNIKPIGCFADNLPRALSHLYFNARENNVLDWNRWPNMSQVIRACASHAEAEGFQVFGIQHYGECWGEPGDVASSRYDIYGPSNKCVQGVGGEWTNFVYRILPQGSEECYINGQEYHKGETIKLPNKPGFIEDTICQKCICQGGLPTNCRELYHCHISYDKCEKYIKTKEDCCPVCGCYNKGRRVPEGHKWTKWLSRDECQECVCDNGKGQCTTRKYWCPPCNNPVIIEGQCCPQCGTPTTSPWLPIPVTTEPPVLTLPSLPVLPPKIKRVLIDRLIERLAKRRRKPRSPR